MVGPEAVLEAAAEVLPGAAVVAEALLEVEVVGAAVMAMKVVPTPDH